MDIFKYRAYSPTLFLFDKEHAVLLSRFLKKKGLFGKVICYGFRYPMFCDSKDRLPFSFRWLDEDEINFWYNVENEYKEWIFENKVKTSIKK